MAVHPPPHISLPRYECCMLECVWRGCKATSSLPGIETMLMDFFCASHFFFLLVFHIKDVQLFSKKSTFFKWIWQPITFSSCWGAELSGKINRIKVEIEIKKNVAPLKSAAIKIKDWFQLSKLLVSNLMTQQTAVDKKNKQRLNWRIFKGWN